MPAVTVYPYLRCNDERIVRREWILKGKQTTPVSDLLADWDPYTDLELGRSVTLDVGGIRSDCGLKKEDAISIGAYWVSRGTNLRGRGSVASVGGASAKKEVQIGLSVPGNQLAGSLELRTALFLAKKNSTSDVSANIPGSVLWEDSFTVVIEGQGGRFPMEVRDFRNISWLSENAAWMLDWDPASPEERILGSSIRLLLNNRNRAVVSAVSERESSPARDRLWSFLYYDTGRKLIEGMLGNDDFVADPESYEEGTIGYHVYQLIKVIFPEESPVSLRQQMNDRTAYFESRLQANLGLMRGD